MKKFTVIFIIFFLFTGFLNAQSDDIFRYPMSPQTTETFRAVCASLAQHSYIRGNFEQEKTLSRLNRSLKSSGNFIIAADSGMVWDTVVPFPSTLVLGSDYLIQVRPGGQKTVLSAQGNETFISMAEVISSVFSGNSRGLEGNFNIYFSGSVNSWELGLIPRDKAINTFAERIVMKGDSVIKYIHISEQNGDSIRYNLSNHNFPAALNDNEKSLFSLP